MNRYSVCSALFAGAFILCACKARAADDKAPAGQPPNADEAMKKMMEFATPSAGHKILDELVGEWNVEAQFWMAGQGGPATTSKGTSKVRWILGNRYLQEEYSGEMMQMPFQGQGLTAYDNFRKKYVGVWVDTMGTGMFVTEGSADAAGKTLTFTGKMDEPSTGEKDKPTKMVVRILSKDKHMMEMHDLTLGEKSKVFEMTYTRKS